MKRIHDGLWRVVQRHWWVFWCEFTGEWAETVNAYSEPAVTKRTVANNKFSSSVHIFRDPKPEAKFLIYVPTVNGFDRCLRSLTPFPRMPPTDAEPSLRGRGP
jgi:hypothetical protein